MKFKKRKTISVLKLMSQYSLITWSDQKNFCIMANPNLPWLVTWTRSKKTMMFLFTALSSNFFLADPIKISFKHGINFKITQNNKEFDHAKIRLYIIEWVKILGSTDQISMRRFNVSLLALVPQSGKKFKLSDHCPLLVF